MFFVYEHWRPDKDECFYVGKGRRDRVDRIHRRNKRHVNTVAALLRKGLSVEVRIIASSLSNDAAIVMEIERIAFWRSCGVRLTNRTDGGEGALGYVHTAATRAKLRARKIKPITAETRAKLSAKLRERMKSPEYRAYLHGRRWTSEARAAHAVKTASRNRQASPEWRETLSKAAVARNEKMTVEQQVNFNQFWKGRPSKRLRNLAGRTFGRLTVVEREGTRGGATMWRCRCVCGNETLVRYANLVRGMTKSCGCLQRKLLQSDGEDCGSGQKAQPARRGSGRDTLIAAST